MFYFLKYGFSIDFKIFGVFQRLILFWHPSNIYRGLIYFILFGRWGDDPRSIIQLGLLGLEFSILDYSGFVITPLEEYLAMEEK
jgi:hypothetical protein